jgi:hypothetical protein
MLVDGFIDFDEPRIKKSISDGLVNANLTLILEALIAIIGEGGQDAHL